MTLEQHFVTFYSPGTFVHETTTKPIDSWDVSTAREMARAIVERYNATPFAFRFTTRTRADDELDSHVSATGPMFYLKGRVRTRQQVEEDNLEGEETLRFNMSSGGYDRIITTVEGWERTMPLEAGDIVLEIVR